MNFQNCINFGKKKLQYYAENRLKIKYKQFKKGRK